MNVLLLEKRSNRPNLALARFSTIHKSQGDYVHHAVLDSYYKLPNGFVPDKLYISIIFSWDIPYLADYVRRLKRLFPHLKQDGSIIIGGVAPYFTSELIEKEFGVRPVTGCSYDLDHVKPDPDSYTGCDETYIFTQRGCNNNCPWCVVPKIEDNGYVIKNWREQINLKAKNVVICDNNLLAAPKDHLEEVLIHLKDIAHKKGVRVEGGRKFREVLFDGGFDWRHLNFKNLELLKDIRFSKIRIAWDNIAYEKGFDAAIRRLLTYFPKTSSRGQHEKIECFVLYNCPHTKDKLEDTLYRCYKLYHHYRVMPYLMRYQPLDTLKYKSYLSPYWNEKDCVDIARFFNARQIFHSVKWYHRYYGRKTDGTTYNKSTSDEVKIINRSIISEPMIIDFTRSFKENLVALKDHITVRNVNILAINQNLKNHIPLVI